MKRTPIIEDWSRFNRAVLDVADGLPQAGARKQPAPPSTKRELTDLVSDRGDGSDIYGLITRNRSRKNA